MKTYSLAILASLMLASCGQSDKTPKITGNVADADSLLITAYYDIDGDTYTEELYTDSLGNFSFDPELAKGTDLTLYINGHSYGARIDNGASVHIAIDSAGTATFSGDNLAESRWLNTCFSGYDARRYKHIPDRDGAFVLADYISIIDSTRSDADKLLPAVGNDSLRAYYNRLGQQYYNRTKAQLLTLEYFFNGRENGAEYPSEVDALNAVDPNDDASRRSGALYEWAMGITMPKLGKLSQNLAALCDSVEAKVTNPANKRMLIYNFGDMLFAYGTPVDEIRDFMVKFNDRLTAHQLEVMEGKIAEIESRTKQGDKIPSDPILVAPDGSKTTLTEACEGKVAYIDMWATWCGPCCAQIPYMEKMAEYYKDNEKVICISISCDEDLDAWHRKLDQDKPEWPQYVFTGESGQKFMTSLGVTGIPRFIIINPDMTIARIDAPRPQSADQVKAIIDELTK